MLSDGTAAVYFSMDGVPAAISGVNTVKVPAGPPTAATIDAWKDLGSVVSRISAGTPTYSFTRA